MYDVRLPSMKSITPNFISTPMNHPLFECTGVVLAPKAPESFWHFSVKKLLKIMVLIGGRPFLTVIDGVWDNIVIKSGLKKFGKFWNFVTFIDFENFGWLLAPK